MRITSILFAIGRYVHNRKGITLVEIAVMVSIISLLIGITVGGLKLQESARMRGLLNQISAFQTAVESFQLQYEDLPGDIVDAKNYWGAACGASAAECNGNGNKRIEWNATITQMETYRAWQHLNLAGFINEGFSGVGGTSGEAKIGTNIPRSRFEDGGFMLQTWLSASGDVPVHIPEGLWMALGAGIASDWNRGPLLTRIQAVSIDTKIDDGAPDEGKVRGRYGYTDSWQTTQCITGAHPNRVYGDPSEGATECMLYFSTEP